ncbi:MAG: acetyl-CoA carboxylase biotin carboxyl carrier protein subunit [Bacteroidetes bacterium]|nr:MAG: acetyl-CoA carboxylase biotin carboxyl carrier protein subunit [Bacteroidota bacterium]
MRFNYTNMKRFKINFEDQTIELTSQDAEQTDLVAVGKNQFHLLHENQSFWVEILETDLHAKKISAEINGNRYDFSIEDDYDQLIDKMGLSVAHTQKLTDIKAPMPGLVLDILVEPGQAVEDGTPLLILEAMKMENILKAHGAGIVKEVKIEKGSPVDKGQVLIEME